MADFYTRDSEEIIIDRVTKGLGYARDEIPKYYILRIAIARALGLKKIPLFSKEWENKKLLGSRGKEYNLEQITGKGKGLEDYNIVLKALFYIKHQEELLRDKKDIFNDEELYIETLAKYIRRGLHEIEYSYKQTDCFYQWCLDNLDLESTHKTAINTIETYNNPYFTQLQTHYKKFGVNITCVEEKESYRHFICKVELQDSKKIHQFKQQFKHLNDVFGRNVLAESCEGFSKMYRIQIAKDEKQWKLLDNKEYEIGIKTLQTRNYKLGIFIGMDSDEIPFCFDLLQSKHIFVAGTTGSGKTMLLCTMIAMLLHTNIEITIIDPKQGLDYKRFESKINIIVDMNKVSEFLNSAINDMEERYHKMSQNNINDDNPAQIGLKYHVIFIDELNDLISQDTSIQDKLTRLAQKARQAGIYLVLGTQRPDSKIFSGALRSNIPSRIALKVPKASDSKIILDQNGAEELLGKGDMLVKIDGMSYPKHIFGIKL